MKNRVAGYLIVGIALLIGFIIYAFNRALTDIVNTSCSHGPTCPMWGSITFQTSISVAISIFVFVIGVFFILGKDDQKEDYGKPQVGHVHPADQSGSQMIHPPKKFSKEDFDHLLKSAPAEERTLLEHIITAQGTIFQSDLVEKSGFSKVKVTRLLDRLEGQGAIERKRRGMTNVVILKH